MYRVSSVESFWGDLMAAGPSDIHALMEEEELRDTTLPDSSPGQGKVPSGTVLVDAPLLSVPSKKGPVAPKFLVVSPMPKAKGGAAAGYPHAKRGREEEETPKKRNSPYTPWTFDEDMALMQRLQEKALAGQKLGERTMQELNLTALAQLSQRSFKAIYNRYNKHLQWRSKRAPHSLAWIREMHETSYHASNNSTVDKEFSTPGQVLKPAKKSRAGKDSRKNEAKAPSPPPPAVVTPTASTTASPVRSGMEGGPEEVTVMSDGVKDAPKEMMTGFQNGVGIRWENGQEGGDWEKPALPAETDFTKNYYEEWMVN